MRTLEDNKGNKSSMRLAFMMCVITACGLSVMGVYLNRDLLGIAGLTASLITPLAGFKAYQKGSE